MKTEILCFIAGFAFSLIPYYFDVKRLNERNKQLEKENLEIYSNWRNDNTRKIEWVKIVAKKLTANKLLEIELELILNDEEQAINWTCVAILECGHQLNSEWVTQYNNYFGLSYNNKPHIFKTPEECILFLQQWINNNPNDKNLPFANYLIDKGWATDPNYIAKFNSVRENYGN